MDGGIHTGPQHGIDILIKLFNHLSNEKPWELNVTVARFLVSNNVVSYDAAISPERKILLDGAKHRRPVVSTQSAAPDACQIEHSLQLHGDVR